MLPVPDNPNGIFVAIAGDLAPNRVPTHQVFELDRTTPPLGVFQSCVEQLYGWALGQGITREELEGAIRSAR